MVKINDDVGGLCYWKEGTKGTKLFSSSKINNAFSYSTYLDSASTIDEDLKMDVIKHELDLGDALTFNRTLLHGATKPQKSLRISIDFRLVAPSKLNKCSKAVKNIFQEISESFDLTRAQNLMRIGDFLGSARILESLSKKTKNLMLFKLAETMKLCPPNSAILKKNASFHWSNEYEWITKAEGNFYYDN